MPSKSLNAEHSKSNVSADSESSSASGRNYKKLAKNAIAASFALGVLASPVAHSSQKVDVSNSSDLTSTQTYKATPRPISAIRDKTGSYYARHSGLRVFLGHDDTSLSSSWSGYLALPKGGDVTGIHTTFNIPDITHVNFQSGKVVAITQWVGIGGSFLLQNGVTPEKRLANAVPDRTLIQAGVLEIGSDPGVLPKGKPAIIAFYEILPHSPHYLEMSLSQGDRMSIGIHLLPGTHNHWKIDVSDLTTGKRYSDIVKYKSFKLSADFIEETPIYHHGAIATAPYVSKVAFHNATVDVNRKTFPLGEVSDMKIVMFKKAILDSGKIDVSYVPFATPSSIRPYSPSFLSILDNALSSKSDVQPHGSSFSITLANGKSEWRNLKLLPSFITTYSEK